MSYASMTNLKDYLGISVATTEDDPLLTGSDRWANNDVV